ncbi:MAG: tRNA (adenosine(37)-N6)-dimethylallyltransferase MiaA [Pseudomonadota bacterium]
MGPTAAGKTALAVDAVERHGVALISVDSALVYRGLDIGTAKPDAQTLARAPHRLIDICDPWEPYSAAEFQADATREIAAIDAEGRGTALVGGTLLYFRALIEGLSALPGADEPIRAALAAEGERLGWPAMHARLAAVDPAAAERIHPNDPQRIQRALEVHALTGQPLSALQGAATGGLDREVLRIVISPADRAVLHARIAERRDAMFAEGFVGEVARLMAEPWFDPELNAMRAVGYRQVIGHLCGDYDLEEARQRVLFATRQLAKRQLTWLRRQQDAHWFDPTSPREMARAAALISRWHDTPL